MLRAGRAAVDGRRAFCKTARRREDRARGGGRARARAVATEEADGAVALPRVRPDERSYIIELRRLPAERARRPGRGPGARRVDRRDEGAVRREGERDPGVDGGHGSVPQEAAG